MGPKSRAIFPTGALDMALLSRRGGLREFLAAAGVQGGWRSGLVDAAERRGLGTSRNLGTGTQ